MPNTAHALMQPHGSFGLASGMARTPKSKTRISIYRDIIRALRAAEHVLEYGEFNDEACACYGGAAVLDALLMEMLGGREEEHAGAKSRKIN